MVTLMCENCNECFTVHNYRARTARFCSQACYNEFRARQAYQRTCAYCGSPFLVTRQTRNKKYCGVACRQAAVRTHDHSDKVCPQCGSSFAFSSRNPNQVFCSPLCSVQSRAQEVDHTFFREINTEGKAYGLGLIFSDGCIYTSGGKYVNFSSNDSELVAVFRTLLSSEHTIYHHLGSYSIVIGGAELYDDLSRLGVLERKSWKEYGVPSIPPSLLRHFLRGYFDGDGCAFISKIQGGRYSYLHMAFTSASRQFLSEVKLILESEGIFPQRIRKDRNNFRLQIGRQDSVCRMVDYLYRDAAYFLRRKYEVIQRFYHEQIPDSP